MYRWWGWRCISSFPQNLNFFVDARQTILEIGVACKTHHLTRHLAQAMKALLIKRIGRVRHSSLSDRGQLARNFQKRPFCHRSILAAFRNEAMAESAFVGVRLGPFVSASGGQPRGGYGLRRHRLRSVKLHKVLLGLRRADEDDLGAPLKKGRGVRVDHHACLRAKRNHAAAGLARDCRLGGSVFPARASGTCVSAKWRPSATTTTPARRK